MEINRRRFVALMGILGVHAAAPPGTGTDQSTRATPPSYEKVRSKLAGTKLFFVPYGHNDYGWLDSNLWDRERLPLVHKEALEVMRQEKDFKWYLDTEFEALSWFLDRHPEMLEELRQRVKEGRFSVAPGSFCNPDNPFMEPEALIRNLVLGRRDFEKQFPGLNLEVAIFNDIHPGFAQIPQLMRQAGYRFYRVTRPTQGLEKKGYKREFIWEGLDGSEILFSYGPYAWDGGGHQTFDAINNYQKDWQAAVVAFYESAVEAQLPQSGTGLIFLPVGMDYARPLRAFFSSISTEPYLDIPGFLREWKRREAVPLIFASPIEYFAELEKVRSTLPRVKEVLDPVGWPYWYGGCGSHGLYTWRERTTRSLVEAEIACSLGTLAGLTYPANQIESLWYDSLTLYPHDGLYVGDEDVADLVELGGHVDYQCRQLRAQALQKIAQQIRVAPGRQAIAVFNPLNWRRREVMEIHAVFPTPGTTAVRVVDSEGRTIPHQILKIRHMGVENQKVYYKEAWMLIDAEFIPSGYRTLYVEPQDGREEVDYRQTPISVLENDYARLSLGAGGIEHFADKARAVEYPEAGNPVFYSTADSFRYHGGPITGETKITAAEWRRGDEGPLRSSAHMTGKIGPHEVMMQISLYHTIERIDFDVELSSVGGSGYFAVQMPFTYTGSLMAGIPFGAEPRDLTREPFGEDAGEERLRKDVFYAHHWVDYSDREKGLTLLATEAQRGFRFDPQKRVLDHILLMAITPIRLEDVNSVRGSMAEWEAVFANSYFRGTGHHTFSYSLFPHAGDWKAGRSLVRAQERVYPVRPLHVYSRADADLPLEKSFLNVAPETVALSAWFRKEDGYHLRLYEHTGTAAEVEVRFPIEPRACDSVDLNGKRRESPRVELQRDRARFAIRPWEIVTLRFS